MIDSRTQELINALPADKRAEWEKRFADKEAAKKNANSEATEMRALLQDVKLYLTETRVQEFMEGKGATPIIDGMVRNILLHEVKNMDLFPHYLTNDRVKPLFEEVGKRVDAHEKAIKAVPGKFDEITKTVGEYQKSTTLSLQEVRKELGGWHTNLSEVTKHANKVINTVENINKTVSVLLEEKDSYAKSGEIPVVEVVAGSGIRVTKTQSGMLTTYKVRALEQGSKNIYAAGSGIGSLRTELDNGYLDYRYGISTQGASAYMPFLDPVYLRIDTANDPLMGNVRLYTDTGVSTAKTHALALAGSTNTFSAIKLKTSVTANAAIDIDFIQSSADAVLARIRAHRTNTPSSPNTDLILQTTAGGGNVRETARLSGAGNFGVATGTTLSSNLETAGSFGMGITATGATITLDANVTTVIVNATGATRVVFLPGATTAHRRVYNIKKIDSSSNGVNIQPIATERIDIGLSSYVFNTQFTNIQLQANGLSNANMAIGWYML